MNHFERQSGRQPCDTVNSRMPFIGHMKPFVGYNRPSNIPLVGKLLPFIPNLRFNRGFTLVELMIALVVLGVLTAIAGPAIRNASMNNKIATETNDMLATLMFARSEAIKRSGPVIICHSNDPTAIPPTCSFSATWNTGWFVYNDENENGSFDPLAESVLRVGDGFSGANKKIKPTASINSGIAFTRLGLASSSGSISICDSRGANRARVIEILSTGRTRINRNATPDCS